MRERALGRTGLSVSEVGLGTWTFSGDWGPVDDGTSTACVRRALEHGVRYVDVGAAWGLGRSERVVARAIEGRRDAVVLGARVGVELLEGGIRHAFAPERLDAQLDGTLARLGTDHVDVALLHTPPLETVRRGAFLETVERWRTSGKARAWGVSVTSEEAARTALDAGAEVLALPYNLFRAEILHPLASDLDTRGVGVIAHSVLEYGLLAGRWLPSTRFGADDHRSRRWSPDELRERLGRVDRVRFLSDVRVPSMAEAAVRFVLATPIVSCAVVGVRTPQQLDELLPAAEGELPYLDPSALTRVGTALGA